MCSVQCLDGRSPDALMTRSMKKSIVALSAVLRLNDNTYQARAAHVHFDPFYQGVSCFETWVGANCQVPCVGLLHLLAFFHSS